MFYQLLLVSNVEEGISLPRRQWPVTALCTMLQYSGLIQKYAPRSVAFALKFAKMALGDSDVTSAIRWF